jgi:hypothetical protein
MTGYCSKEKELLFVIRMITKHINTLRGKHAELFHATQGKHIVKHYIQKGKIQTQQHTTKNHYIEVAKYFQNLDDFGKPHIFILSLVLSDFNLLWARQSIV